MSISFTSLGILGHIRHSKPYPKEKAQEPGLGGKLIEIVFGGD